MKKLVLTATLLLLASQTFAACVGDIDDLPPGLKPAFHLNHLIGKALNEQSGGDQQNGGLCQAQGFTATQSRILVYRVYSARNRAFGRCWSFAEPTGTKASYADANAICPERNDLDRLMVCQLTVNAPVVVGTGAKA